MLVELDKDSAGNWVCCRALVEIIMAYPDTSKLLGKETGWTVLVISPAPVLPKLEKIDLTYDEFRWAYTRSVRSGEPFLDLKNTNLPHIKQDYARYIANDAVRDRFPHRPS